MITVSVCVGSACHLKGSYDVINRIQVLIEEYKVLDKVELKGAFCLGHCTEGVSVIVNEEDKIYSVNRANVDSFFVEEILGRIS